MIFCKIELGNKPGNIETIELKKLILNDQLRKQCFMKIGRYSDDDCINDRQNYIAVLDLEEARGNFNAIVTLLDRYGQSDEKMRRDLDEFDADFTGDKKLIEKLIRN